MTKKKEILVDDDDFFEVLSKREDSVPATSTTHCRFNKLRPLLISIGCIDLSWSLIASCACEIFDKEDSPSCTMEEVKNLR